MPAATRAKKTSPVPVLGKLDQNVTLTMLQHAFGSYGDSLAITKDDDNNWATIRFRNSQDAAIAAEAREGVQLCGGIPLQIYFGKANVSKHHRTTAATKPREFVVASPSRKREIITIKEEVSSQQNLFQTPLEVDVKAEDPASDAASSNISLQYGWKVDKTGAEAYTHHTVTVPRSEEGSDNDASDNASKTHANYSLPKPWPLDTPWKQKGYKLCTDPAHQGIPGYLILHSAQCCPLRGLPGYWDDLEPGVRATRGATWRDIQGTMPKKYKHLAVDEVMFRTEQGQNPGNARKKRQNLQGKNGKRPREEGKSWTSSKRRKSEMREIIARGQEEDRLGASNEPYYNSRGRMIEMGGDGKW